MFYFPKKNIRNQAKEKIIKYINYSMLIFVHYKIVKTNESSKEKR